VNLQRVQLVTLKARLTELVGNNSVFWVDQEKRDAFNEALCVFQAMTGTSTEEIDMGVQSGEVWYSSPLQICSIQRISWNGTPLTETSLAELDNGFPGWEDTAAGTPLYWAPSGLTEFILYPPASSGSLHVEGISDAVRVFEDGDWLNLEEEKFHALLAYGHHYLTFKEGGVELESSMGDLREFVLFAADENAELRKTSLYRRYMGLPKDETENPPSIGQPSIGARS
jgi:hypothetical protein